MRAGPLLFKSLVLTGSLLQAAASHAAVVSNITGDGTLGTAISRSGNVYGINGGTIRGSNQFHSFGAFTVGTGDVASFNGPPVIANILGRVTGGQQSVIDGILRSTIGGANLFLLNPSGVLFGPNASLDLTGAFHVSTADYLRLADGAKFFANLAQDSVLSAAAPAAFGFLGPAAASITIQGSTLAVPEGQTLSVVGGDIQITGATLVAPSGRIQIASVASAGEAVLNGPGGPPGLDVSSFPRLGQIEISTSLIDASDLSGFGGGTVFIRGGRLVVDASTIRSDTFGDLDGAQPGIDLGAHDDMILTNATSIGTATFGGGRGGDVQVAAGSLQMDGTGTAIRTSTDFFAFGNAGDVSVTAGAVTLTNGAVIGSLSLSALGGRGGAVTVNAPAGPITISGRDAFGTPGGIFTETDVAGDGGPLAISAASLIMDDGGAVQTTTVGAGRGGDLTVAVKSLTMKGGATIKSVTASNAQGGNVTITASEVAALSGGDAFGPTQISADACFSCTGDLGAIALTVGKLSLLEGALIQSGSIFSDPKGGNVTVTATNSIVIGEASGISSRSFNQDAGQVVLSAPTMSLLNGFIDTSTLGAGRAGDIVISNVGALTLAGGGQIASSSQQGASGHGGNVTVTATGPVSISGRSASGTGASPFTHDASSGLFSTAEGTGDAGQITVFAPTLTMADGGKISVATSSDGRAGSIALNLSSLSLASGARIDTSTAGAGQGGTVTATAANAVTLSGGAGIFSNAEAGGAGGDITLQAFQMQLTSGGILSAKSSGTGDAGKVTITVGDSFIMRDSTVTTQAIQADGGNISIRAPFLVFLTNSQITTSVMSGVGKGGNITIDPQFVILNGSQIRADAFGGPGGNVLIVADVFLTTGSVVSASSALGVPGIIDIQATVTDVSGNVAKLPADALQATALLRASCAARLREGKSSSLVLAGRGGVPPDPVGVLPTPFLDEGPADARFSRSDGHRWETLPRLARVVLDPQCSR